jgi:hypothetical protein
MNIKLSKKLILSSIIYFQLSIAGSPGFIFQPSTIYTGSVQPGFGSGINAFDFDLDGDVDIFIPTAAGDPNQLLVNQGNGSFVESATMHGLADTRVARSALWMDYEGDGDYDLLIARDCYQSVCNPLESILSLYENINGQFTEITNDVGLFVAVSTLDPMDNHLGGLSAGDLNNDGNPDIYVPIWQTSSLLYFSGDFSKAPSLNKGDIISGYVNGSNSTGIGGDSGGHWQALFHDFNDDLSLDLFVNVDFHANQLWLNQGSSPYNNVAATAGVNSPWNEMGLAAGDYDSDGDIDLFITNIYDWLPQLGDDRHNLLYRNDSIGSTVNFTDTAINLGVDDTGWGWGATWIDAENDGDLDLAVTNGYCQPAYCGAVHKSDQSRLFLNPNNGSAFVDASAETGFNDTDLGSSLVKADFNNDGLIDLLQTTVSLNTVTSIKESKVVLFTNQSSINNAYLKIQLSGSNLAGTVLTLIHDNYQQAHLVTLGTSFLGQEPLQVQYGLGTNVNKSALKVEWPEGFSSYWGKNMLTGSALSPMIVSKAQIFSHSFE